MKKKLLFIVTLMVVVSVSTTILLISSYNETKLLSKLALNNIETLTQDETVNWIDSHSVDLVSIVIREGYWSTLTSHEGLIYPFWVSAIKESISCCVLSNQSSKCNKALMDPRCS